MKIADRFCDCMVLSNTPHLLGVLLFIAVKRSSTLKKPYTQHDQTSVKPNSICRMYRFIEPLCMYKRMHSTLEGAHW